MVNICLILVDVQFLLNCHKDTNLLDDFLEKILKSYRKMTLIRYS